MTGKRVQYFFLFSFVSLVALFSLYARNYVFSSGSRYLLVDETITSIAFASLLGVGVLLALRPESVTALRRSLPVELPMPTFFDRHQWHLVVLGVLLLGILVRALAVDTAAVNRDTGLYLYDGFKMLHGQVPIVDYHSRSPLFHLLLAGILAFEVDPLLGARAFMAVTSVLIGAAVYALTVQLASRRAGLVAMGLFLFAPLTVYWGLWLKTEQVAALLVLGGLAWFLSRLDGESILRASMVVGVILGVTFLVRRTGAIYGAGIAIAVVYYRFQHLSRPPREVARDVVGMGGAAFGTIFVGYAVLTGFSPSGMLAIAEGHLFTIPPFSLLVDSSGGNGPGYDLWLINTIRAGSSGLIFTLPAALATIAVFDQWFASRRSCTDTVNVGQWEHEISSSDARKLERVHLLFRVGALLGTVCLTFVFIEIALPATFPVHGLVVPAVLALVAVGVVIYRKPVDSIDIVNPKLTVLLIVLFTLIAGYLLWGRPLHTSYYQELFPFMAILGGIIVHALIEEIRRIEVRYLLVGLVLTATYLGMAMAPHVVAAQGGINMQHQADAGHVTDVQEVGDRLEAQTAPDERIFSAQPIYALQADRHNLMDFSREVWYYRHGMGEERDRMTPILIDEFENGSAAYVLVELRTEEMLDSEPKIREAKESNYCRVEQDDPTLNRLNTKLYMHNSRPSAEC